MAYWPVVNSSVREQLNWQVLKFKRNCEIMLINTYYRDMNLKNVLYSA